MSSNAVKIGWIGIGRMGYALATRLLEAGYDVSVYNRTRAKAEPLAALGAKIVDRPVDLADRDVVFTMVSAPKDLKQVTVGEGGLLTAEGVSPRVIVDSSTVSEESSAEIRAVAAERGTQLLAAPVSGNPSVIAAGMLTVAVSGPRETFDEVEDLLKVFGRGVTYVGEGEVARLVKIAHNVFLGVVTQSLAEITVLAETRRGDPRGVPGVPQRLGDGLGLHPVQVAGVRQPRLHAHVHQRAAAARTSTRAWMPARNSTCRCRSPRRPGSSCQAIGAGHIERGLRRPARSSSRLAAPATNSSPRTTEVDDGLGVARVSRTPLTGRSRPRGTWGSTTRSGWTSTGCATTGSAGRRRRSTRSECGAFLLFDFYNIRYTTQTWIGGALGDKMIRYALLTRDGDPILWDFGSAVKHHKLYSPWLPEENCRAGLLGFRGAVAPDGRADAGRRHRDQGPARPTPASPTSRSGVDIVEPPFLFEMQRQGLTVVDAQQHMLDARVIKSPDEIMLLNQAAAMVDGVYQDIVERAQARHPGERDRRAGQQAALRDGLRPGRGDQRDLRRALQPAPAQLHRPASSGPGDQAFFDIIHSFNGYRTCYYRTFAVGSATAAQRDAYNQAREWMDAAIDGDQGRGRHRPGGRGAAQGEEFGFGTRWRRSGCSSATGSGSACTSGRSSPGSTRLDEPVELKAGMVFALETYCPAPTGSPRRGSRRRSW